MDTSWIDRYFEGDLTPEEKQLLEQRLADDPALKSEWDYRHALKKAIHRKERAEMKNFLEELERRRLRKRRFLTGAAASLVLLTGMWFYLMGDNSRAVAEAYFHPLPNMVSPVVRSADLPGKAAAAFRAYEAENYSLAVQEFKAIGEADYAVLYQAVSYLAIDSTEAAFNLLNGFVTSDENLPLESYRKWYLGITWLRKGEKKRAELLFAQLTSYDNPVRENARQLLKQLR